MGVRRGSFEKIRMQPQAWRQNNIDAHIPAIDVAGNKLRALAEVKKSEGEAEAEKWKGIGKVFDLSLGIIDKYVGIKRKQYDAYADALADEEQYAALCASDKSKYSPELAMMFAQRTANRKKTYESFGIWKREADTVSKSDVIQKWMYSDTFKKDNEFLHDEAVKDADERLEETGQFSMDDYNNENRFVQSRQDGEGL